MQFSVRILHVVHRKATCPNTNMEAMLYDSKPNDYEFLMIKSRKNSETSLFAGFVCLPTLFRHRETKRKS